MGDRDIPIEAARIQAFAGGWIVSGTLDAKETRSAISGRWQFEPAADGWGVRGRMQTTIEGWGSFEEDELIGYDPTDGTVHMFSLNRFAVRDHRGAWVDTNELEVEYTGRQGGRQLSEVMTVSFPGPGQMVAHIEEHADGELVVTTDLSLVATAGAPEI